MKCAGGCGDVDQVNTEGYCEKCQLRRKAVDHLKQRSKKSYREIDHPMVDVEALLNVDDDKNAPA